MLGIIIDSISTFMYSKLLVILLIGAGIYFTIRTKLPQMRLFKDACKAVVEKPEDENGVSSFQALMVSTASRVGTGNIIGVSSAICIGGFGSVFWMWIIAIIGSASALIESTLAQIYKRKGKDGECYGGPAYYIEAALHCRPLAIIFCISMIATYAFGFNMLASYNLQSTFSGFSFYDVKWTPWIIGGILAVITGWCLLGGGSRIVKVTSTFYGDIADEINAGNTAPLIYVGWENTLVNTGYRMLEYIQDKATIKDVVDQLDKDQDRVVNNKPEVITTTTEVISQKSCAKLIGRCFMEATKSDAALISLGKWIKGNGKEQNMAGVNGKLYAQDITESDICSILPTGWYDTIQTVQLSGREIKQLCKDGYDAAGTGNTYPYVLVKDKKLEADQTYKVVICGAGKELTLNDSGIVGMNAAKDFFSKFKTLSEADVK